MNTKETKPRQSKHAWETLAEVLHRHGDCSALARFIHGAFSEQMIRAWRRMPESDDYRETGRISPLDRIDNIIDYVTIRDEGSTLGAHPIAHHVAERCGGVFFPLPAKTCKADSEALQSMTMVLQETSGAVEEFRQNWFDNTPGRITAKECEGISREINQAIAALIAMRTWAESKTESR